MMRALWTVFVCGVFWLAISDPAAGQERYALLIGNKDYSAKIGPLKNPINDVALVRDALIEVGFKRENIEVLTNAKQGEINRAKTMFGYRLKAAGPDSLGFFYYSGHGAASKVTETGQISNYIIPIDVEDNMGPVEM